MENLSDQPKRMAERPQGYGLTAEVKAAMDAKYSPELGE